MCWRATRHKWNQNARRPKWCECNTAGAEWTLNNPTAAAERLVLDLFKLVLIQYSQYQTGAEGVIISLFTVWDMQNNILGLTVLYKDAAIRIAFKVFFSWQWNYDQSKDILISLRPCTIYTIKQEGWCILWKGKKTKNKCKINTLSNLIESVQWNGGSTIIRSLKLKSPNPGAGLNCAHRQ